MSLRILLNESCVGPTDRYSGKQSREEFVLDLQYEYDLQEGNDYYSRKKQTNKL